MDEAWLRIVPGPHEIDDSVFIDENFIENEIQDLKSLICCEEDADALLRRVAQSWMSLGLPRRVRDERKEEIRTLLRSYLTSIVKTEEESLNRQIDLKESLLMELDSLSKELGEPPFKIPENQSLLTLNKILLEKCKSWKMLKDARLEIWDSVADQIKEISAKLGCRPPTLMKNLVVPTGDEIHRAERQLSDLNNMRQSRYMKFATLKTTIIELVINLEKDLEDPFEQSVVHKESDQFILSEANMRRLIQFHADLEAEAEINMKKRKMLDRKLHDLWQMLEISETQRNIVLSNSVGYKPSAIRVLEEELERLEELKKEHLEEFIIRLRPQIQEMWDKCYVGADYRIAFAPHLDDTRYTDELLAIHEAELSKLQHYYDQNERIFDKIEEHGKLWERLKELEKRMNDPSRFNNRGGALLKEEKERKKVWNGIPKVEKELMDLGREWEALHEENMFCVWGMPLDDYVNGVRAQYEEAKENEKKSRMVKKKLEIEEEARGRKVAQKRTPLVAMRKTPVKKPLQSKSSENNTPLCAQPKFGSAKSNNRVLSNCNAMNQVVGSKTKSKIGAPKSKIPGTTSSKKGYPSKSAATPKRGPRINDETFGIQENDFQEGQRNVTVRRRDVPHHQAIAPSNHFSKRMSKSCLALNLNGPNSNSTTPLRGPRSVPGTPKSANSLKRTQTYRMLAPKRFF